MAQDDSDQWVAMVGDILKTYPAAGTLNTNVEQRHTFYHEVLADLRKLGKCTEVSNNNRHVVIVVFSDPPLFHFEFNCTSKQLGNLGIINPATFNILFAVIYLLLSF